MNNKIYIISLIFIGFILNILFYIFSDNYRYFLQSLKQNKNAYNINDKFQIKLENITNDNLKEKDEISIFAGLENNFGIKKENKIYRKKIKTNKDNTISKKQEIIEKRKDEIVNNVEFKNKKDEFKITNIEKEILKKFEKYKVKKVDLQGRLFGLTSEYPNEYEEYYNKELNLYLFGNKHYEELEDIFQVLSYEIPISVNKVNNFGKKSFYINLNKLFKDDYVRIVLEYKNRTFGLKIKENYYNKIKNDLGLIFHK